MPTPLPLVPLVMLNLLGLAGIIVWHLQGRGRPNARLVVQIIFFAAMTAALLAAQVAPFRFERIHEEVFARFLVDCGKVLWWTHLAWAVIGFTRIYIVLDKRPREARLIQDLLVAVVYLGTTLSMMAFVFGMPIGTLLATSGVVAIILGLALQNTLSDVFSGIALTIGRPYVLGDWILLADGTEGRVVASNWRATCILTSANNLIVLPNSVLAKLGLTNFSRPTETHQIKLPIRISPTLPPSESMEVLSLALDSCKLISREAPPTVALKKMDGMGIDVELLFYVSTPGERVAACNEVIDAVFRHCAENGVSLAMPAGSYVFGTQSPIGSHLTPTMLSARELLRAVPAFAGLPLDERNALGSQATTRQFPAGATIVTENETFSSLMIIQSGIVCKRWNGKDIERLYPGEIFGARSLLSDTPESGSFEALTEISISVIAKEALDKVIGSHPQLAKDLASRLSRTISDEQSDTDTPLSQTEKTPVLWAMTNG
ncbi:small mechanosensitive ion channel [Ensifer sp. NM-2]|uniref:cyclic nucleotide-binding domain-containing protein n=1 Tax=unclassified Ensifer TaxID=2633371 RepID=UPI00070BE87D|nr:MULTISPECIES: mechanosensitive ion channel family protein [unclassified Ensifer]KQU84886.1 small mechanosensitive ion channel [Ensifer sp. Root31]KQW55711.1 small mechanosensitive ion channel [Ensifer sp. Root127]PSS64242.1 small mechanosensitive ion channel [Ensifer sp. NM-2]